MNYALYLQNGGSTEPRQFSEEEIAMIKTLLPYGEAFKQSPGGAIEMAARELNFNLDSPAEIREFLTGLDAYARLIDDVDLINDIQKFGQESNLVAEESMFKCGGKVRAKVKKARCGKKLEKGAKVPVEKKGGCPCQYKKIGGHIKLVDCNGIPVAKNGNILKFEQPSGPIEYTNNWTGTMLDYNPTTSLFRQYNRTAKRWENLDPKKLQDIRGSKELLLKIYNSGIDKIGNILLDNEGNYTIGRSFDSGYYDLGTPGNYKDGYAYDSKTGYTRYGRNFQNSVDFNSIYDIATKSNDLNLLRWLQSHNNVGYRGNEIDYNGGKAQWDPTLGKYVARVKTSLNTDNTGNTGKTGGGKTAGLLMFERSLAPGTLSDYSLQGRQNWVNSAENEAYLEANGWDAAKRAAYKGSVEDNRELLKLILGRAAWTPESASNNLVVVPNALSNLNLNYGLYTNNNRLTFNRPAIQYTPQNFSYRPQQLYSLNGTNYNTVDAYNQAAKQYNAGLIGRSWTNAGEAAYSGGDVLKSRRFDNTKRTLMADQGLQKLINMKPIEGESDEFNKVYMGRQLEEIQNYLNNNYKGADLIRARKIMLNYLTPTNLAEYKKDGGKLTYADYLK